MLSILPVGFEHRLGHQPEESGQDDPVNLLLMQVVEHGVGVVEVGAAEITGFDAEIFGALRNVCVALIINDTRDLHVGAAGEVFADLLCVGAVAGAQDG